MANSYPITCPSCNANQLRWITLRKGRIPIDVLQCTACNVGVVEEDWVPPLVALIPGRCWNCGDRREMEGCVNCGLTRAEDTEVHTELKALVGDPEASYLDAARAASRVGRRLLALKLATAAATTNDAGQGEVARALRIWLLAAIGETQFALEDAKAWIEHSQDPSALAWASYGQQLQNSNVPGVAADAYEKSLRKNPKQHNIRARRSQLLIELGRGGQALEEVIKVLSTEGIDDPTYTIAAAVAEQLCDGFENQYRDDEIERLLKFAGQYVDRSARLLAHRARILALRGDLTGAKQDLKNARRLAPDLDIYARVEASIKPQRSSWWRW